MKIYASEGTRLTNGVIFGKVIDLGAGDSPNNYHEITDEEYNEIMLTRGLDDGGIES